jgi:hypothetical protein
MILKVIDNVVNSITIEETMSKGFSNSSVLVPDPAEQASRVNINVIIIYPIRNWKYIVPKFKNKSSDVTAKPGLVPGGQAVT